MTRAETGNDFFFWPYISFLLMLNCHDSLASGLPKHVGPMRVTT